MRHWFIHVNGEYVYVGSWRGRTPPIPYEEWLRNTYDLFDLAW